jgi:hypothetical protein
MKVIEYFENNMLPQDGEVGIEIEVEGFNLPHRIAKYWTTHHDGSLRGDESLEYVFAKPLPRQDFGLALAYLDESWKKRGSRIDESPRAGVHAHINVQQLTEKQLVSFFCLYSVFEDLIVKYCGKEREGNLFCLRLRDAEYLVDFLITIFKNGNLGKLLTDRIRYASVNMSSIPKYGSMEFRAMRSTRDMNAIKLWVDMLLMIKDKSLLFNNPSDIITSLSAQGDEAFLNNIMGQYAEVLHCKNEGQLIREGVRRIQELAFTPIKDVKKKELINVAPPPKRRYIPKAYAEEELFDNEEEVREWRRLINTGEFTDEDYKIYDGLHVKRQAKLKVLRDIDKAKWEAAQNREAFIEMAGLAVQNVEPQVQWPLPAEVPEPVRVAIRPQIRGNDWGVVLDDQPIRWERIERGDV